MITNPRLALFGEAIQEKRKQETLVHTARYQYVCLCVCEDNFTAIFGGTQSLLFLKDMFI